MTEPSAGIVPANGPSPRRPSSTGLDRPDASLGLSNPNPIGSISATGNGIDNRPSSAPKAAAAAAPAAPIVAGQPAILNGNDSTSSTTRNMSPPFPDGGVIKEKSEGGLITPHRATSATATDTDTDHAAAAAAAGVAALPGSGVGHEDGSHGEDGNGKGSDSVAAAAKAPGAPGKKKMTVREFPKQFAKALWRIITSTWMNLLLVFVPAGIVVAQIKSLQGPVTFALNCVAIIPLAGLLSFATESVARKMGDAIGALMNITFGNAVELIIFIIALTKDEIRIVQASLLGSILANLLLILGMCFFFGGLRYREQIYNSTVTQMSACLLSLSVISLVLPTAFHASFSDSKKADIQSLKISRGTSIILLLIYMLYLLFQLNSHAYMYESTPQHIVDAESTPGPAANWLDSSSSEDSSDSNTGSDSSYRSRDTVRQKVKKVLRAGRRRKSSVTSVDTQEDGVGAGSSSQSQDQSQGQGPRRSTPPLSGSVGFAIGSPVPSAPEEAISEASSSQAGGHHRRRRSSRPINIGPKDEFVAGKDDSEDEDATGHSSSRHPHRHRHHHRKHHHHHHGKKQRKRSRREAGDDAVGGDGQLISPVGSAGGASNSNGLQIMVEGAGVPRRVDFAVPVPNNANPGAGTAAAGSGSVARRGFPTLRAMSVKNFAPTVFVQKPDTVATPAAVPVGPVPRVRYGIRRTNSLPDRLNRQIRPPGAVFPAQIPTSAVVRALAGGGGGGGGPGGGVGSRDGHDSIDGAGGSGGEEDEEEISRPIAIGLLLLSTGLVAVCAEFLVGSIREVTSSGAVPEIFIGLIILPIVGNAAEHVTAITVAMKNKMDLAIGVAVGSSIQIALFITPVVVILGWILNHDMTLYFTLFETVCLFVSTFIVNFLVLDGRSNYLEGALLCATYVIISVVAFFYPQGSDASSWGD